MTEFTAATHDTGIGRLWRPVGFTISYPFFALGCCLLALAPPFITLSSQDKRIRVRRMRRCANVLARSYLRLCSLLGLTAVEFKNAIELPPGLVVANHPTLVDAIWIIATQPDLCCVLKGDLQRFKVVEVLVKQLGWVSNRDPEQLLQAGCERLKSGETMLVFPEGTRTPPGQPVEFRLGAAELALRAGVPIHPIVIHKQGRYLSKSCPWYEFPADKLRWVLTFHPTVVIDRTADSRRLQRRVLTEQLQTLFRRRLHTT